MQRLLFLAIAILGISEAVGADWPQYRCDASRSAASPEPLPSELALQWVRHFPTPRPAFPSEIRLGFDTSYEPVVFGRTMFVPSMVTDSVMALDAETGAVRWQFFTDGPVRFSPVAWGSNIYFVSDDGYLYCVDATDGRLRWKFRSLPPGRGDRKIFGSGRLISLFPARGGPVLQDGVVYFGAGIWSGYGVAIHAVDAQSGKVVWSNTDSNRIPKANMDHGIAHDAGLSPQGYLAVVHDALVVPCGTQLPAFLELKTGRLKPYRMGWGGRSGLPKGTWFVAGTRNYLCHGGDLYDVTRPNDEAFEDARMRPDFKSELYPGGYTRVSIDSADHYDLGAFQEPVFASSVVYTSDQGLAAYDLAHVQLEERKKSPIPPSRRDDPYPDKWKMAGRELWKMPSPLRLYIKAGKNLYLGGPGVVEAVRIPDRGQTPRVVWRTKIAGTPHRMLAAWGRLFVVTREGAIYAFTAEKRAAPLVHSLPAADSPPTDAWTKTAADIVHTTQIRDGYALVLGIGAGRLVEELLRQTNLQVIALDRDPQKVDRFRRKLQAAGLYGVRTSACVGDPLAYPLPPYMASLIVSEDWAQLGMPSEGQRVEAVFPTLRPYGGKACLLIPPDRRDRLVQNIADLRLTGATVRQAGDWVVVSRDGPLAGSADWSHAEADAANTGASEDQSVHTPLELLWFDTPPRWYSVPGFTLVRVCGGRMFIKSWKLHAFDVYTGRRLWEAELPFPFSVKSQMVALDDAIYLADGRTCLVLDPASGRKTGQIDLPADLPEPWSNLRVWQDHLIGQSGKYLVCCHRRRGRLEWKHACGRASLSLAVWGGQVFYSELLDPKRPAESNRNDAKARALDIETGNPLWQIPGGSEVRYSRWFDLLVMSSGIYRAKDGSLAAALPSANASGDKTKPSNAAKPLFLIGRQVLVGTAESFRAYDIMTGAPTGETTTWTRRGCTIPRASANLVTTRFRGNAACIDLATREVVLFWNVRPACSNNLYPADGVLNMPSLTLGCTCNYLPVSQAYVSASAIPRTTRP